VDEPKVYFSSNAFVDGTKPRRATARETYGPSQWSPKSPSAKASTVEIGLFTKVPRLLFGSGTAARLGRSALCLFVALCEHANRHGRTTFSASDEALACDTGMSPRTICDARKRLREHGMIQTVRTSGSAFRYTILPQAFEWKPLDQRQRRKLKPRAYRATATV